MKCACAECGRSGGYALYCLRCAEMFIKQSEQQLAQEPVGKFAKSTDGIWREVTDGSPGVLLYTAPPQSKEDDDDGRC